MINFIKIMGWVLIIIIIALGIGKTTFKDGTLIMERPILFLIYLVLSFLIIIYSEHF